MDDAEHRLVAESGLHLYGLVSWLQGAVGAFLLLNFINLNLFMVFVASIMYVILLVPGIALKAMLNREIFETWQPPQA